jgi:predicted transcriptional regulator
MDAKEQVIDAMKQAGKPVSAGEVEKLTGLERKEVDKIFKVLKKDNTIVSPVRCKWEVASE